MCSCTGVCHYMCTPRRCKMGAAGEAKTPRVIWKLLAGQACSFGLILDPLKHLYCQFIIMALPWLRLEYLRWLMPWWHQNLNTVMCSTWGCPWWLSGICNYFRTLQHVHFQEFSDLTLVAAVAVSLFLDTRCWFLYLKMFTAWEWSAGSMAFSQINWCHIYVYFRLWALWKSKLQYLEISLLSKQW